MSALPTGLLDWGQLAPLQLRAREIADGLYSGGHRSKRRGSGIEFDGHRDYVPGDDLRRLDYRALMRHGRLLVRQFETETDRNLCLLVDATYSMAFSSGHGLASKLAYASLLAAALGRIAVATGDLVSLDWLGGEAPTPLPKSGGREAFERLIVALERVVQGGEARLADGTARNVLHALARRSQRGAIVVLFSDLLDLPETMLDDVAALSSRSRRVVVIQVLDPVELRFPFDGAIRLRPSTGGDPIETDAGPARRGYLAAMTALQAQWGTALIRQGGRMLTCSTEDAPAEVVRRILGLIEGDRL